MAHFGISSVLPVATAWVLTYLVHSTALAGAAWIVRQILGSRHLAAQEALLRTALIGGIVTATLQVGLGLGPWSGAFTIQPLAATEAAAAHELSAGFSGGDPATATPHPGSLPTERAPVPTTAPGGRQVTAQGWLAGLAGVWLVGAGIGLIRLLASSQRLRALMRDRRQLPLGRRLRRLAAALGLSRPLRVSASGRITVPFATGLRRPEVCLPERAVDELSDGQREGLLAHEMAHLARRDPAWALLYRVVEGMFFFQPLNRLLRTHLHDIAECLSDDRAAACTGRGDDLARCLVEVAHWTAAEPRPLPVVPAASRRGHLGQRVERLLDGAGEGSTPPRWIRPLVVVTVLAVGVVLPGISCSSARPAQAAAPDARSAALTSSAPSDLPEVPEPPEVAAAPSAPASPSPEPPPAPPEPSPASVAPMPPVALAPPIPEAEYLEAEIARLRAEVRARVAVKEARQRQSRQYLAEQVRRAAERAREHFEVERLVAAHLARAESEAARERADKAREAEAAALQAHEERLARAELMRQRAEEILANADRADEEQRAQAELMLQRAEESLAKARQADAELRERVERVRQHSEEKRERLEARERLAKERVERAVAHAEERALQAQKRATQAAEERIRLLEERIRILEERLAAEQERAAEEDNRREAE